MWIQDPFPLSLTLLDRALYDIFLHLPHSDGWIFHSCGVHVWPHVGHSLIFYCFKVVTEAIFTVSLHHGQLQLQCILISPAVLLDVNFYRSDYAVASCPSVRPFVRLSFCLPYAGIISKRLNVSLNFFYHLLATPVSFFGFSTPNGITVLLEYRTKEIFQLSLRVITCFSSFPGGLRRKTIIGA